jgi:Phage integrase family
MYGEVETEPRFLTQSQFAKLCTELPPHLSIAARFAVLTLLRMRAQSRLTWDRVDLPGARAWVPSSQMKGAKTFGFPLSPEAVRVLREARLLNPDRERVFQYDGRPVENFNTRAFKKAAERAGVAGLRWHDLRHTGASWAVQSGVTLQELMALGDWKSYSMVLRYAHLSPANAAGAAQAVGTSVAHALRRRKNPTERKLQAERQLKWWVLTVSNRRPSPCKDSTKDSPRAANTPGTSTDALSAWVCHHSQRKNRRRAPDPEAGSGGLVLSKYQHDLA